VATTSVELSARFPKGTTAGINVRVSDVPAPGPFQANVKVGDDGKVKFTGLTVGAQYVVNVEGFGLFNVQAKDASFSEDATLHRVGPEATGRRLQADREAQADAIAAARKKDPSVSSPAPGRTVVDNSPERKSASVEEPQPGPKQQETSGPQRSDTPDGLAVPKDPKEAVPDVKQEDIGATTPQRSSTDTGVAAVKDRGEQVPAARQEDVAASTPQRSSTPSGTAEPKPVVKKAEVQKRDDSSANRARGNTPVKSEEVTKPKATPKATTRTGTPKRATTKK
jgi:hypothetical protein